MLVHSHLTGYPCPIGIGSLWNTGTILGSLLYTQVCTGTLLGLHYTPSTGTAYYSVLGLYREVYYGSMYRYTHTYQASMVLLLVLVHVYRGVLHGSYIQVSQVLAPGTLVYQVLVVVAFMGYILPWGLMSYWGATVITNLCMGVPGMVPWVWGDFHLSGIYSLGRYWTIHLVVPVLVPVALVLHVLYIHRYGTSPGIGYSTNARVHFHTWLVCKDTGVLVQGGVPVLAQVYHGLLVLAHPDNSLQASAVYTPLHIVPE